MRWCHQDDPAEEGRDTHPKTTFQAGRGPRETWIDGRQGGFLLSSSSELVREKATVQESQIQEGEKEGELPRKL